MSGDGASAMPTTARDYENRPRRREPGTRRESRPDVRAGLSEVPAGATTRIAGTVAYLRAFTRPAHADDGGGGGWDRLTRILAQHRRTEQGPRQHGKHHQPTPPSCSGRASSPARLERLTSHQWAECGFVTVHLVSVDEHAGLKLAASTASCRA